MKSCTTVTKVAIITIKAGIRTLSGITDLRREMTIFAIISTKAVAKPIQRPFVAEVVVANVGHIPKTSTQVGFSLIKPFLIMSIDFIIFVLLSGRFHKQWQ